jgi:hypothetical protein
MIADLIRAESICMLTDSIQPYIIIELLTSLVALFGPHFEISDLAFSMDRATKKRAALGQ